VVINLSFLPFNGFRARSLGVCTVAPINLKLRRDISLAVVSFENLRTFTRLCRPRCRRFEFEFVAQVEEFGSFFFSLRGIHSMRCCVVTELLVQLLLETSLGTLLQIK